MAERHALPRGVVDVDDARLAAGEQHPLAPQTTYHVSKLAAEYMLQTGSIPVTILRVPAPTGLGMSPNSILPTFVKRCVQNEPLMLAGKGGRIQTYLSASEIARAVELSLSNESSGVYLLPGESVSNIQLAELCQKVLGKQSGIMLTGRPDPHEKEIWDVSGEKIARELGFIPQMSLEEQILMLAAGGEI